MKTYEFSQEGLSQAINDRKHYLRARKGILISIGIIALVTVLNVPSASVIAFTTL